MILYQLKCDQDHRFESWFRDSGSFARLAEAGEVACPECASRAVTKAPMAPRIARGRGRDGGAGMAELPTSGPAAEAAAQGSAGGPGQMAYAGRMRAALQEFRRMVEANSDYVGDRFADEARKMHDGEAESRNIYGETSDSEAEALREDGVPFARIPWPKDDA